MSTRRGKLKPRDIYHARWTHHLAIKLSAMYLWICICSFHSQPLTHTHSSRIICVTAQRIAGLMVAVTTKNEENINWISRTHTHNFSRTYMARIRFSQFIDKQFLVSVQMQSLPLGSESILRRCRQSSDNAIK